MNERVSYEELPSEIEQDIARALEQNGGGFEMAIKRDGVMRRQSRWYVPVRPSRYPENLFDFYGALAKAEIAVRDNGHDVHLTPEFKQRYLVIFSVPEMHKFAIRSYDGDEYEDLDAYLKRHVANASIEGLPYNSAEDLENVVLEVQSGHPEVRVDLDYVPLAER